MKIAMLAPISWRVPPRTYGPWERVVSLLTEQLVADGVDVTLFATADSQTSARLVGTVPRGYSEDPDLDAKVWECLHIATVMERADEFDLIHNHFDFLPLSYAGLIDTPMVTTIHGFSSERILPVYRRYDGVVTYVSISDADRHPDLTYAATVHHGIDLDAFTFREAPGDYLLFFGRIHHDKGVAEAIEAAQRADVPLVIAGIVHDEAYYAERVAPHVDRDRVRFVGAAGPAERDELLGGALALLHLVNFAEPFGLSVVEAMACGTPVIARPKGSLPELVTDGVEGFLVEEADEAAEAVARVGALDRRRIREIAQARFSAARMARDYERVYARVLGGEATSADRSASRS